MPKSAKLCASLHGVDNQLWEHNFFKSHQQSRANDECLFCGQEPTWCAQSTRKATSFRFSHLISFSARLRLKIRDIIFEKLSDASIFGYFAPIAAQEKIIL
jgi:hypothetical protein